MNFNLNSIIENVSIKSFNFKTIDEINKYRFESVTDQSNIFTKLISNTFRVISDECIYYFNENNKLWEIAKSKEFESFVYDFFNNTSKEIKKLLKITVDIDDQVEKKIKELCGTFDTDAYINKIIKRSTSKLTQCDFLSLLDSKEDYLPIKNGKVINLRNLEIRDRKYDDFFSYESPVDYVKSTPNANKFFEQLQPKKDNRELLRKILGYNLTGNTQARKFFIFYGFGANGKSKIFKILEKILCKQYTQVDKSIFCKQKAKSSGGASPEIMDLMGRRLGCYSEGETADEIEMNMGLIKQISGEDKIVGRPLYCSQISFYPYIKLNMLSNFTPRLQAEKAIKERLIYMFLDTTFVENPNPKKPNEVKIDKIFAEKLENEYLNECFSWIIQGAVEYYKDLRIEMTEEFKQRTDKVLSSEDSIETFTSRCLDITDNNKDYLSKNQLFESYRLYCQANSQRIQFRTNLWNRLEQNGLSISCKDGYDVYRGLKFKILEEDEKPKESPFDYGIEIKEEIKPVEVITKPEYKAPEKELTDEELENELSIIQQSIPMKKKTKTNDYTYKMNKSKKPVSIDDILQDF